jgi:hypothetical protein
MVTKVHCSQSGLSSVGRDDVLIFRRYKVQGALFFSWKDLEACSQVEEGTTRDISSQAAFVR